MSQTVVGATRHEGEPVKGSRFIVDIATVNSEAAARQLLERVRADYPDASHHCWAWRIAQPAIDRASDDGEPRGSAGRPILAQLTGRDLVDTAVVVTRYFGGTKLGVGGLVRAYGSAAGDALDTMTLSNWVVETTVRFAHDYAHTDAIERLVQAAGASTVQRYFEDVVRVELRLPLDAVANLRAALSNLSAGAITLVSDEDGGVG